MKYSLIKIVGFLFSTFLINSCKEVKVSEKNNFNRLEVLILLTKTIHSFEINENGEVIELEKSQNEQKFFKYKYNQKQLEIFKEKINTILRNGKKKRYSPINFVDGTSYILSIKKRDKVLFEMESVFGDELNEVDELIVFILRQNDNNEKQMLFEEYLEYEKTIKILNERLKIK